MSLATRHAGGFTLIELLVVVVIIGLLTVATLPIVVPSIQQSQINSAAQLLQAELSVARDTAVRTNAPHGIRFVPDEFNPASGQPYPNELISSKFIAIEQGPDYSEGLVRRYFDWSAFPPQAGDYYPPPPILPQLPPAIPGDPNNLARHFPGEYPFLVLHEEKRTYFGNVPIPNPPTSWYFNLRQGDKIQLNDSGRVYTIAGPIGNPDPNPPYNAPSDTANVGGRLAFTNTNRFINFGRSYQSNPANGNYEFLFLVDGEDNDGDGFIDEGFDGIDNDGDGIVDPGFNGIDDDGDGFIDDWQEQFLHRNSDGTFIYPGCPGTKGTPWPPNNPVPPMSPNIQYPNEWEADRFAGTFPSDSRYDQNNPSVSPGISYVVTRRSVPSPGAREISFPPDVRLDLTTWDADKIPILNSLGQPYVAERSRVPVDPATGYVDVLISPGGQVIQQSFNANPAPPSQLPYYHFWLAEIDDIANPFTPGSAPFLLPMLKGSGDDPDPGMVNAPSAGLYPDTLPVLRANRRLVTLNTQTGQIATTSIETMYTNNPSYPFKAAESGQTEEP